MTDNIFTVLDKTWPAAHYCKLGPWVVRKGNGGGKRVSATTVNTNWSHSDIALAEDQMSVWGQENLFMIRPQDVELDTALERDGYTIADPVNIYTIETERLTDQPIQLVTTFCISPPLAIQREIWNAGGIDDSRQQVMTRTSCVHTTIFGRINAKPAATAYVAIFGKTAMVHAIEVTPSQQKQGLGKMVMRQAAYWATDQGAQYLSVICTQKNIGANALYHSLGMKIAANYHYRKK